MYSLENHRLPVYLFLIYCCFDFNKGWLSMLQIKLFLIMTSHNYRCIKYRIRHQSPELRRCTTFGCNIIYRKTSLEDVWKYDYQSIVCGRKTTRVIGLIITRDKIQLQENISVLLDSVIHLAIGFVTIVIPCLYLMIFATYPSLNEI